MRILIATVAIGSGHVAAASALEEAWRSLRPRDVLETVDVLALAPPLYQKIYTDTYLKVVEHAPELYALIFKRTDDPGIAERVSKLRRPLAERLNRRFVKYVKQFRPDIMICPHYLPLEILTQLERKGRAAPLFSVCVITDFEAHALWMEGSVDLYCVAAETTKARLVARGAPADKVVVTGIPIAAKFSELLDAVALRRRFGLWDDLPVLLVLGGGFGLGPVADILKSVDGLPGPLQLVVVAGKNEELRKQLACIDYAHPTRVLGFVSNMHEWMAVADAMLTKPGGLTSAEALAMGKPLIIFNPIPGQEQANSDFLLERGAAIKVNALEDLPYRIERLFGSKKLIEMRLRAKVTGRPDAALDLCRAVMEHWEKRAEPQKGG